MRRHAILIGTSSLSDYRQKSLSDVYLFLKSKSGGFWRENEILIMPNGLDLFVLNYALKNISLEKSDFLFMYFCGNASDTLNSSGFTVGKTHVKFNNIENICESEVIIFDSCEKLIGYEEFYGDESARDSSSENKFIIQNGTLFFSPCKNGGKAILKDDGEGLYTQEFIKSILFADGTVDFCMADKSALFSCSVYKEEKILENRQEAFDERLLYTSSHGS